MNHVLLIAFLTTIVTCHASTEPNCRGVDKALDSFKKTSLKELDDKYQRQLKEAKAEVLSVRQDLGTMISMLLFSDKKKTQQIGTLQKQLDETRKALETLQKDEDRKHSQLTNGTWSKDGFCLLKNGPCPVGFTYVNGLMYTVAPKTSGVYFNVRSARLGDSYTWMNEINDVTIGKINLSVCCKPKEQ